MISDNSQRTMKILTVFYIVCFGNIYLNIINENTCFISGTRYVGTPKHNSIYIAKNTFIPKLAPLLSHFVINAPHRLKIRA